MVVEPQADGGGGDAQLGGEDLAQGGAADQPAAPHLRSVQALESLQLVGGEVLAQGHCGALAYREPNPPDGNRGVAGALLIAGHVAGGMIAAA
jgi:hypothetical protein